MVSVVWDRRPSLRFAVRNALPVSGEGRKRDQAQCTPMIYCGGRDLVRLGVAERECIRRIWKRARRSRFSYNVPRKEAIDEQKP
jgi:hypothetical protein